MRKPRYKYYLKDKDNHTIIEFEVEFNCYHLLVFNAKLLDDKAELPFLVKEDEDLSLDLYLYLENYAANICTLPPLELDDWIIHSLELSDKIRSHGRLSSLKWIVALLQKHYQSENYYITADDLTLIYFAREVLGWDKLLIDKPVLWEDL